MERLSFRKIARTATLMALPLAAGVACGETVYPPEQTNTQLSTDTTPTPTSTVSDPKETETQRPYGVNQPLVDKVVNNFGGAVVVTVQGLDADMKMLVRFQRVDIPDLQKRNVDDDSMVLTQNQSGTIFAASSCFGEFAVSISLDDGYSFNSIPIPDIHTRIMQNTFKLQPDCTRPIQITFPKVQTY